MKVAIDYTLGKYHIGGMGVFVRNLVNELQKIKENKYVLFENKSAFGKKGYFNKILPAINEQLRYQFVIPKIITDSKCDIAYFPNPPVPLLLKSKSVLNIPDMSFFYEKELPIFFKVYLYCMYFISAQKATIISTFSEYSKNDIVKILKVPKEKVTVIALGVSDEFKHKKSIGLVKSLGINTDYILCTPGTLIPRKNVADLLKAYGRLPNELKSKIHLVIVGKQIGSHFNQLEYLVSKLKLEKNVMFLGYVQNNELLALYSHARLFVYPSLYEGFGLPPLEAMMCGVPVIGYNYTSLPEVIGKAGILVNDHFELATAIKKVLQSPRLQKKLIQEGFKQVKKYRWEITAKNLTNLFYSLSN